MKKVIALLAATMMVVTVAGCSDSGDDEASSNDISSSAVSETETSSEESDVVSSESGVDYAAIIPDPEEYFPNSDISVVLDNDTSYMFQVRNYEAEEYEAYVAKCKEMGFADISYDTETSGGRMYGAYSADGEYWVEALRGDSSGIVSVICQASTNNE